MHRRIVFRSGIIAIAALAAALPQSGRAQSNLSTPDLANLAAGVLERTHQARQLIGARDRDGAMTAIRSAIATASEIQQSAPAAEKPLMVPVYSQLETTTTTTPVHRNGNLKHNSSVRGVDGERTTGRLDITAASERLAAAQAALQSGDWNTADGALAAVESSVTVTETTGAMPLRMARQNLEIAKARVLEGKYHEAEMPLRSAAQALGEYAGRISGRQARDIEATRQTMMVYSTKMPHDQAAAAGQIDSWMEMLRQWGQ
jgi:hypothetical protein